MNNCHDPMMNNCTFPKFGYTTTLLLVSLQLVHKYYLQNFTKSHTPPQKFHFSVKTYILNFYIEFNELASLHYLNI